MKVYNTQQRATETRTTIQPCTNCCQLWQAKARAEQRLLLQILHQLLEQPTTQSLVPTPLMPKAMKMKGNSPFLLPQTKKNTEIIWLQFPDAMKDMKEFKQIVVQYHCHRCTSQSLGSLKMTNRIDANTRKAQRKHMIPFMSIHSWKTLPPVRLVSCNVWKC